MGKSAPIVQSVFCLPPGGTPWGYPLHLLARITDIPRGNGGFWAPENSVGWHPTEFSGGRLGLGGACLHLPPRGYPGAAICTPGLDALTSAQRHQYLERVGTAESCESSPALSRGQRGVKGTHEKGEKQAGGKAKGAAKQVSKEARSRRMGRKSCQRRGDRPRGGSHEPSWGLG